MMLLKYEILSLIRNKQSLLETLLFFVLMCVLFPLAISPEKQLLQAIAPGTIWLAAVLSQLLVLQNLFKQDATNGMVTLWILSKRSLVQIIANRLLARWLLTQLPLILLTPFIIPLFYHPFETGLWISLSLLIGTPILLCLGALVSVLCLPMRQQQLLLGLILLPLYIPVLIFSVGFCEQAMQHLPVNGIMSINAAILCVSLGFLPLLTAAALKMNGVE